MISISVNIPNQSEEVSNLLNAVNAFLKPRAIPPGIVSAINLVVEESLINTINYGYPNDGDDHVMTVTVNYNKDEVYIRIEDDGTKFNPLLLPVKDKSDSPPESEKGLGIHLIRNMMNAMTYSRENEKNILEIWIYY